MIEQPYTLPEEDPFNITPLLRQPRRRRSSLFNKWILDQQAYAATLEEIADEGADASCSTPSAEPTEDQFDVGRSSLHPNPNASAVTLKSYDFVDDDDIPRDTELLQAQASITFDVISVVI